MNPNYDEIKNDDLETVIEEEVIPYEEPAQELVGGEIVLNEETPEGESLNPARIARAVQVFEDVVVNVILVAVDAEDNPVGFETPYGTETVIVDDESPASIGWHRIDDEFVNPDE